MTVANGENASAEIFNAAFVSKTDDNTIEGEITLNNADSGSPISNLQQQVNDNIDGIATNTADIADHETRITSLEGSTPFSNFSATTAPTVDNDTTEGYSAGSFWLDTVTNILYILEDATTGAAVWNVAGGAGGTGGGSLRYFYQESFDSLEDTSDFTTDNGVIGTGGNTFAGALALETTAPLSGDQSLKYTQASGSEDDYFESPIIDVPLKFQNGKIQLSCPTSYTGNSGDERVYIWDETNSTLIQDADGNDAYFDIRSGVVNNSLTVTLDGTEQLKYIFQVVTENSGAILLIDDVEILGNPDQNISITASSPATQFTPVFTGLTLGNGTANATWERDRNWMKVHINVAFGSTTSISGVVGLNIPNGESIDFSKYASSNPVYFGTGNLNDSSSNSRGIGFVIHKDATSVYIGYLRSSTIFDSTPIDSTEPFTWTTGDGFTIDFEVPILGWSDKEDNVVVANTSNRLAYVEARGNGSGSVTADVTDIDFTEVDDEKGLWNGTQFTANRDMIVMVEGSMAFTTVSLRAASAWVNDGSGFTELKRIGTATTDSVQSISGIITLNTGDTLSIRSEGSGGTLTSDLSNHHLTIQELPSENLIYAYLDESRVAAKFQRTSVQSLDNDVLNTIFFDNAEISGGNNITVSSDTVTLNLAGLYNVSAGVGYTTNGTGVRGVAVYKNGVKTDIDSLISTDAVSNKKVMASGLLEISSGDTLTLHYYQNSGANLDSSTSFIPTLSIHRIR